VSSRPTETEAKAVDIVPENGIHATDWRARDRETGHHCHSAVVHPLHEYVDTPVWAPPYEHNPLSVHLRWCKGVKDETPYPTIEQDDDERGYYLWTQDEDYRVHPATDPFPVCRRVIVGSHAGGIHIETEVWKKPPREWPPAHVGENGSGLSLDEEQAKHLRDWLIRRYPLAG